MLSVSSTHTLTHSLTDSQPTSQPAKMAFTMHSHSGQFCPGHAKDQLEDVILHAIELGFKTMGLSEHMPRTRLCDLYPDEVDPDPSGALAVLAPRHAAYLAEARRLQAKYAGRIELLVGFEAEFIRPADYAPYVRALAADADYFVGSLHHAAAGVPIDFDRAHYLRAAAAASPAGGEEALHASYYDEQLAMLEALRPRVVGHFDLIRLLSEDPGRDVSAWSPVVVWPRARRNLAFVAGYGGWLECNTSALRKGLDEPYPSRPVAEEWLRLGGKFTFSDDSHGIAQLATNYSRGLDYLESLGVTELWTFERRVGDDASKVEIVDKCVPISEFRASLKSVDAAKV
ncbi:hypothetical protein RB595_006568 [Gaeumannomyces hyphopodioides]